MANSIELFKQYIAELDEVYKQASATAKLDMSGTLVQQGANANELIIPKISMDGLADYSRSSGYVSGDVALTMETVQYNYDRGRAFTVDAMDNLETVQLAFGRLAGELVRTKAVPELDAFRFAKYAGTSGISSTEAALTTGQGVIDALVAAQSAMDEDEVPFEDRHLFITPTLLNKAEAIALTANKNVLTQFASVNKVAQTRFYTAIDLKDGTTENELVGGYAKASGGKDINFMIIHRPSLLQYSKHVVNKIITPELNQTADGWKFFYRAYGLADVYENKVAGIYMHNAAA